MKEAGRSFLRSYRTRLALGYALLVALVAAAWGWSLYGPLDRAVLGQQRSHLETVARAGALVLAESDDPVGVVAERVVEGTGLRLTVVAADGRVLADTEEDPATMEDHGDRPEVRRALRGRVGTDIRRSATQRERRLYVAVPASLDGSRVALRLSESLQDVGALAGTARRTGLLLLIATGGLALLVASRLTESAAAPISRLAASAKAMAAGRLETDVPEEAGELGVLSSALRDLRGQMRARLGDLEGRERDLRAVLDGLDDAVFLLEGTTIAVANRAASSLFKTPYGGWRGRDVGDDVLPGSLSGAILRALRHDERTTDEEIGPDPTQRYLRLTTTALGSGGRGDRTLVVVQDITDRMRLEAVRRDFVANASHELKTPASGIQLLAETALTAAEDGDTGQALVFVAQIKDEADRLRRLVLDLLDLSRLETVPAPGAVTDLREAIDLALVSHRHPAERRGLALTADTEAVQGTDVFAAADPTDVTVALDNLLDNAIAYTESGSVTVRLEADADEARIVVSDTGAGIPAEDLPRVFERFYRVDRSRARHSGGTGLGLALVRHVVERSGGMVAIDSEEGVGTTVTLRLRRAR